MERERQKKERKSFWKKLDDMPSWFFLVIPLVLLSITIVFPIGIPIGTSDYTTRSYQIITSMPPGSIVVFQFMDGATAWDKTGPGDVAVIKLLWSRNLKVIFYTITSDIAVPVLRAIDLSHPEKFGKVYGKDYVVFGFAAGGEIAIASFCSDIWKTFPIDYYGNPTGSLDLMQNVKSAKDVNLLVTTISGWPNPDWLARQWSSAYGTRIVGIEDWGIVPITLPYYPTQIQGILPDVEGASQLEHLTGFIGLGSSAVDAKSVGGILILLVFVIGNIVMIGRMYEERTGMRRQSNV